MSEDGGKAKSEPGGMKLVIELAPLLVFFVAYMRSDMRTAALWLAAATIASVIAARLLLGNVSTMLWVTATIATVAATFTYLFDDPRYLKMKPTFVNLLFAGGLGIGLLTGRTFLKVMMGDALRLTDEGWRKLTVRWIGFFLALAVANEMVWRLASEQAWVNFKVFGLLPLTIAFTLAQIPLMTRYAERQ